MKHGIKIDSYPKKRESWKANIIHILKCFQKVPEWLIFFSVPGYLYESIPILSYCHIRVNKPPNNKQFGTPGEKI